jgi:hypothetical protein
MNQQQLQTQKAQASPKKASVIQVAKIVSSSFLGVSKRQDNESEATEVSLQQIVVVALVGVAVFIGLLLVLVTAITK